MNRKHEKGNASIGVVIGTALTGLLYLQNIQQDMSLQVSAARDAKMRSESNEAALYALSVASQLLKDDPATDMPKIVAENILDAPLDQTLTFRGLAALPGGTVALSANGDILITSPLGGQTGGNDLNQLFSSGNFNTLKSNQLANGGEAVVRVSATRHEPFPTGYGIQQLILDASVQVTDRGVTKDQNVRALLNLDTPGGECELELFADGTKVPSGSSLLTTQDINANLKCTGVIYSADINVNGTTSVEGPLTRADSYLSDVPALFQTPVAIDAEGVITVTAGFFLLDGTRRNLPPQTLNVAPPPPPTPTEPLIARCLEKCQECGDFPMPGCITQPPNSGRYRMPFTAELAAQHLNPLPLIEGPLNGPENAAERAQWQTWSNERGLWNATITFQSLAFPRQAEVLVCQNWGDDWVPAGFDATNNCEPTPVLDRGFIGCLDPESGVTVRPGETVAIKNLRAGDTVYNPITHAFARIEKVVRGPEKKPMNRLVTDNRELILTANHPVMTADGEKLASEVTHADQLLVAGVWEPIASNQSFIPGANQEVWNIQLSGDSPSDHWIEANGMVVGDLWMQEHMNR